MSSYKQRISAINQNVINGKIEIDNALQEIGFTESTPNETFQQYADWIKNHLTRDNAQWDLDIIIKDSFSSLGLDLTAPEIASYQETQLSDGTWNVKISLIKTINQWDEEETIQLPTSFWEPVQQNLPGVISANTISYYMSLPTFTTFSYPLNSGEYIYKDCSTGAWKERYKGTINIEGKGNGESTTKVIVEDCFFDYINISNFSGHFFQPRWQGYTNNGYADEFKAINVTGTLEFHNLPWYGDFIANNFATFSIDNSNLQSLNKKLSLIINGKNEFINATSYYMDVNIKNTHLNLDLTSFNWKTFKLSDCILYSINLGTFSGLINNRTHNEIITFENCDFQNRNDINLFLTALINNHNTESDYPLYIRFKNCKNYSINEEIIQVGESNYIYIIEEGVANVTIEYYKDSISEENLAYTLIQKRVQVGETLIKLIENNIVSPEIIYGYKYSGDYEVTNETVEENAENIIRLILVPMTVGCKVFIKADNQVTIRFIEPQGTEHNVFDSSYIWQGGKAGEFIYAEARDIYNTMRVSKPPVFWGALTEEQWNKILNGEEIDNTPSYVSPRSLPSNLISYVVRDGEHYLCTAYITPPEEINITVTSDGINSIKINDRQTTTSQDTITVYELQPVTLEAIPTDGYEFDYWETSWGQETENPLSFFDNQSTTVTAVFKAIQSEITSIRFTTVDRIGFSGPVTLINETTGETLFEGNFDSNSIFNVNPTDTLKLIYKINLKSPYVRFTYTNETWYEENFIYEHDDDNYENFHWYIKFIANNISTVDMRCKFDVYEEYYKNNYSYENRFRRDLSAWEAYAGDMIETWTKNIDSNALEGYKFTSFKLTNEDVGINQENTIKALFTPIEPETTSIRFYDGDGVIKNGDVTITNTTAGETKTVPWKDMDFTMDFYATDNISIDLTDILAKYPYIRIHRKDLDNYELMDAYSTIINLTASDIIAIEFRQTLDLYVEFYKD